MTSGRAIAALVVALVICALAAGAGSLLTFPALADWYPSLKKPVFNPPNAVFGPVWTILFTMMAFAAWRVFLHSEGERRTKALSVFAVQLALNVAWSGAFFAAHAPLAAFIVLVLLWIAIAATIAVFARIDRLAAWLLVPYIAWVSFAGVLNAAIVLLN